MVDNYTYTDADMEYEIGGAGFTVSVTDTKRSTSNKKVNVTIKYEVVENSNNKFGFQYREMNYPGNSIKPRDLTLLSAVSDHIRSFGFPVWGSPSIDKSKYL